MEAFFKILATQPNLPDGTRQLPSRVPAAAAKAGSEHTNGHVNGHTNGCVFKSLPIKNPAFTCLNDKQ